MEPAVERSTRSNGIPLLFRDFAMSKDSIAKTMGKMRVDMLYGYDEVFGDDRDKSKVCTLLMDILVAPLHHLLFSIERSIEQRSGTRKHVRKPKKREGARPPRWSFTFTMRQYINVRREFLASLQPFKNILSLHEGRSPSTDRLVLLVAPPHLT